MITLELQTLYLLLISNAVLLMAVGLSISRFERHRKAMENFRTSPTGFLLSEKIDEGSREQDQITRQLNERVSELQESVNAMESGSPKPRQPLERFLHIENAQRMARLGASIDDLTKSCGLNVGEARLIKKLHGKANVPAPEECTNG